MNGFWYKNIQLGDVKSVNLDLNNTDIIDLNSGDQFIKTCSSNQSFIIVNEQPKNFRLLLTGGSINSTLFRLSNKTSTITRGVELLEYYDANLLNILDISIFKIEDRSISINISLKTESIAGDIDVEARDRLTNLENHETIYQLFQYVGKSTSGTLEIPEEATIYDIYQDGVIDAIVVEASAYQTPVEKSSLNSSDEIVQVYSVAVNGDYQLATTPVENSCILYFVKIKDYYKENIPISKIIGVPLSGHDGVNGLDGLDINWRGSYSPTTLYALNDAVSYLGSSYIWINITPGSGQTPSDNLYWDILAIKGDDGYTPIKGVDYNDGINGTNGTDGIDGTNGADGYTPIKGVDYFDGINGTNGTNGVDGADGAPGPNEVTTSTASNLTGILKGNGTNVTTATEGTDYTLVRTLTSSVTFENESNYEEVTIADALASSSDNIQIIVTNNMEDCAIQGFSAGWVSTSVGVSHTIYCGNTNGMTGTYNLKIIIL